MDTNIQGTDQPKPGAAAQQPAGNVVSIDQARKESGDAAHANALEVTQLCALAGRPDMAAGFLETKKSVADVRAALLAEKAKASAEISSQHGGQAAAVTGGGQALIGECKRLAADSAKKTA